MSGAGVGLFLREFRIGVVGVVDIVVVVVVVGTDVDGGELGTSSPGSFFAVERALLRVTGRSSLRRLVIFLSPSLVIKKREEKTTFSPRERKEEQKKREKEFCCSLFRRLVFFFLDHFTLVPCSIGPLFSVSLSLLPSLQFKKTRNALRIQETFSLLLSQA